VIWISIDDVKAASLGCYGRERNTSPHLDALAREGVRFQNCITQAGWTLPSYASMLTSHYPFETVMTREYLRHLQGETEVARSRDPYRMPEMNRHWYGRLAPGGFPLAVTLGAAGLRTAAWTNNQWLSPKLSGLDQGFREYHFTEKADAYYTPADETLEQVGEWIQQHRTERFFVLVHLMDPHKPWRKHPEYGFGDQPLDQYEAGIRFTDDAIGKLAARLKEMKVWDRTLLIVNSDHGEGIYQERERFVGHGGGVIPDLIRVPLILVGPGLPQGRVVESTVRNLDILPTILALLDITPTVRGSSLAPLWSGPEDRIADNYLPAVTMAMMKGPEQISIITRCWQVVMIPAYQTIQVLPWGSNQTCGGPSGESEEQAKAKANEFVKELIEDMKTSTLPPPVQIDPETAKKLKALGYLQ